MPWSIQHGFGDCTGFAVVNDDTDELEGCFETRPEAEAKLAELQVDEGDGYSATTDPLKKRKKTKLPTLKSGTYSEPVFLPDPVFMAMDPGQALGVAFYKQQDA